MKKIFFILFFCIGFSAFAKSNKSYICLGFQPPDTTVLSQILALNLQYYIGKPVDSLFSVLPGSYTDRGFMPYGIGYSKGVFQSYGTLAYNTVSVQIYIDNYQYMSFPNFSKTTTWNMDLAKQESISYIRVLKNNVCIYGCNNPNYYD